MSVRQEIAIYGAGGSGREVAWLLSALPSDRFELVGYVDDGLVDARRLDGTPVLPWDELCAKHPRARLSIAVGDPATRRRLVEKSVAAGFEFVTLVHPSVALSPSVCIGAGALVGAGSIVTVDVVVGDHAHINVACTLSHDVRIGAFSTLSPGVHVSGNVHVGEGVFLGTGANIIHGSSESPLVVGDWSVVAAGACVTRHVEPRTLYAGVPATFKRHLDR